MDPISLGIAAVGLGLQVFGGMKQSQNAKEVSAVNQDIARQEQSINDAKMRQMELEGRRMQIENVRNTQRMRAQAVQAGVNQGAQLGSGLQGGLAAVQNKGLWNMMGVDAGLSFGREVAGYNQNITQDKYKLASLGAENATAQGYQSLGGAMLKAGPIIGQVSQGFGGSASIGTFDNGWGSAPTFRNY